ncbi:C1q-related factor isoform X2 [Kryptolebias marmoratus]|uniref:Cerebellin 20 n=1 Tax=Kryptolebias marmoratus TaxID=37003 RepID=A0A3Q3BHH9_KRYMA|nr:C1q-related factor isoform X2 [Kryptolebias marmoratus]
MKAMFLCLLHAAFVHGFEFPWSEYGQKSLSTDSAPISVCRYDPASCGCCLMQRQIQRMEQFFNNTVTELNQELTNTKMILHNLRASRSAFSVALNNQASLSCFGPFSDDRLIIYQHVFLNLGDNYNPQTGVFTVPSSGAYSLAVTIYGLVSPDKNLASCANLQVNGQTVAPLSEKHGPDSEDSSTAVVAVHLNAGDKVSVSLPSGCTVCDDSHHFNTFTGFLLYAV